MKGKKVARKKEKKRGKTYYRLLNAHAPTPLLGRKARRTHSKPDM
jgi:hypothetical protein